MIAVRRIILTLMAIIAVGGWAFIEVSTWALSLIAGAMG